jgi:hypothetical protein
VTSQSDWNAGSLTLEVALPRKVAQCFSDRKAEFHPLRSLGDDVASTPTLTHLKGLSLNSAFSPPPRPLPSCPPGSYLVGFKPAPPKCTNLPPDPRPQVGSGLSPSIRSPLRTRKIPVCYRHVNGAGAGNRSVPTTFQIEHSHCYTFKIDVKSSFSDYKLSQARPV